jgi:hypothetical protein
MINFSTQFTVPYCQVSNSIQYSPSWESSSLLAGQEISPLLWSPNIYITVLKRAQHWSLFYARLVQSTSSYPLPLVANMNSWYSKLVLFPVWRVTQNLQTRFNKYQFRAHEKWTEWKNDEEQKEILFHLHSQKFSSLTQRWTVWLYLEVPPVRMSAETWDFLRPFWRMSGQNLDIRQDRLIIHYFKFPIYFNIKKHSTLNNSALHIESSNNLLKPEWLYTRNRAFGCIPHNRKPARLPQS